MIQEKENKYNGQIKADTSREKESKTNLIVTIVYGPCSF